MTLTSVHSHLLERGLVPSLYSDLVVDEEERVVTFPLYNTLGKYVGYQTYRPDQTSKKMNHPKEARYFTYLPREVDGVWGYGRDYSSKSRLLFLVEGVFKAAALHRVGFNGVAVLGASPKRLRNQIFLWRYQGYKVVALGDNDAAGREFVRFVGQGCTTERDLDELTDEEVNNYARAFYPNALL